MGIFQKEIKQPSYLIIDGAMKNEVLLDLNLLKMAYLANPIRSGKLVVCLYPKSRRVHSELTEGNTKSVCPMAECVVGVDNKTI